MNSVQGAGVEEIIQFLFDFPKPLILFSALFPAFSILHYSLTVLREMWSRGDKRFFNLYNQQKVQCGKFWSPYISFIQMFSLPCVTGNNLNSAESPRFLLPHLPQPIISNPSLPFNFHYPCHILAEVSAIISTIQMISLFHSRLSSTALPEEIIPKL